MVSSAVWHMKELLLENRLLKLMYSNLNLEHLVLKNIAKKNSKARTAAGASRACPKRVWLNERRACRLVNLSRGIRHYLAK